MVVMEEYIILVIIGGKKAPPLITLFFRHAHWHLGLQLHFDPQLLLQEHIGPQTPLHRFFCCLRLDLDFDLDLDLDPPKCIIVCGSTLYKLFVK